MNDSLHNELMVIFRQAKNEVFEDGMHSNFSRALFSSIDEHGIMAVSAIESIINHHGISDRLVGETLRWLGHNEDDKTIQQRRAVIESFILNAYSISVLDDAICAVSYLEDSASIPALEKALQRNIHHVLKDDIREIIHELSTQD